MEVKTEAGTRERTGEIGIVVLAAGESARMGQPKQLLVYNGKTLLRHAVETALTFQSSQSSQPTQIAQALPVVVVLGAHSKLIGPELEGLPVCIVENLDWRGGMGYSLRAGLRALLAAEPQVAAALFLLCDQPHITPPLLQLLEYTWRQGAVGAASQYETRRGVPAIFDAQLFPELLALQGAEGARQLLAKYADVVVAIPFPQGAIDVDNPADYAALISPPNMQISMKDLR